MARLACYDSMTACKAALSNAKIRDKQQSSMIAVESQVCDLPRTIQLADAAVLATGHVITRQTCNFGVMSV